MPSDLTAAVEAAKEIVKQSYAVQGLPSELQGGYVNTAIRDGYKVADALLDLTSQPLYRRRKAEWSDGLWRNYRIEELPTSKWYWTHRRYLGECGICETQELAQAACEEHFWAELERDAVERVN